MFTIFDQRWVDMCSFGRPGEIIRYKGMESCSREADRFHRKSMWWDTRYSTVKALLSGYRSQLLKWATGS
jgi:hypothetical protein